MKRISQTDGFRRWFDGLRDRKARARIQVRIDRAEEGHLGDCAPVGAGVSEMRIHYGSGYRVYFIEQDDELIILLAGGDKQTQPRDIQKAIELARGLRQ